MASDIEIDWVGYCDRDGSDKIWGICGDEHDSYTFWCRRGKTVRAKVYNEFSVDRRDLIRSKEDRGYWKVPMHQLDEMHPGLLDQLGRAIVLDKLRR
jgi:hypothetical protein